MEAELNKLADLDARHHVLLRRLPCAVFLAVLIPMAVYIEYGCLCEYRNLGVVRLSYLSPQEVRAPWTSCACLVYPWHAKYVH